MRRSQRSRWMMAALLALFTSACSGRERALGLWFADDACVLRAGAMDRFGEPLSAEERSLVAQVARGEVEQAFSALRVRIGDSADAFWRLGVVRSMPARSTRALPRAGESVALGMLGGGGTVACDVVARKAINFAPASAVRADVVTAIGRGVGRTAVHEFVHQILGAAVGHDDADTDSYEHGSSDRASQYYGALHWTIAWPELRRRLGVRSATS